MPSPDADDQTGRYTPQSALLVATARGDSDGAAAGADRLQPSGASSSPGGAVDSAASPYLQKSISRVKRLSDATMESMRRSSPLPLPQIAAICATQLSQAIQVTLPYTIAVFMVRDYGFTDEQEVSQRTGLMASYYCLAMFLTAYFWGKFSDRFGRKPVVVIGNATATVSVLLFGFSRSYEMACLARFVGGFFNGIFGSLKTMIGESCDASSQGQALVFLSISWGIGTTLGPLIGGLLARPCQTYAGMPLCGEGELMVTSPFLLPCLAAGAVQLGATVMSMCLMQETLPSLTSAAQGERARRGFWGGAARLLSFRGRGARGAGPAELGMTGLPPANPLSRGSSRGSDIAAGLAESEDGAEGADEEAGMRLIEDEAADSAAPEGKEGGELELETPWWHRREVVLCLLGYGLVAFIFNLSDEVTPIYASVPASDGGLGLSTSQLGIPLAVQGVSLLLYASFGFKRMQARLGVLRLARAGLYLSAAVWLLHPAASLLMPNLPGALGVLCVSQVGKAVAGVSTFTSSMVLVNVASPPRQLGRVNGVGQSVAAFVRGVGPAAGGFLWALTLGTGLRYHQFIVYSGIAVGSLATVAVYGSHLKIAGLDG
eukprot:jgi/Tetstr1/466249/TSEL_010805.t1